MVVFSTAPAMVLLSAGDDDERSFHVEAGVTKLSRPLIPGRGVKVRIERSGAVVAECAPRDFVFDPKPAVYNFNAFTAMSP